MISKHFRPDSFFQSLHDPSLAAFSYIIAHRFSPSLSSLLRFIAGFYRFAFVCNNLVSNHVPALLMPLLPFKTEPCSLPVALDASLHSFCPSTAFTFPNTSILAFVSSSPWSGKDDSQYICFFLRGKGNYLYAFISPFPMHKEKYYGKFFFNISQFPCRLLCLWTDKFYNSSPAMAKQMQIWDFTTTAKLHSPVTSSSFHLTPTVLTHHD